MKNYIDKIIWILFYYLLLVDSINGFFLNMGIDIPISQSYKTIMIFLISIRLLKKANSIFIILITSIYSSILFLHFSSILHINQYAETFNHLFKFVSTVFIFIYAKNLILTYNNIIKNKIISIFKFNSFVLIINILLGMIGLGYTQYDNEIGYKGFFFAGNELSGVALILFPFLLYMIGTKYSFNSIKYISLVIILMIVSVLMSTKTAIIGILLAIYYVPKTSHIKNKISNRHIQIFKKFSKIFSLITIIIFVLIIVDKLGILERWSYFYNNDGILSLLSGRDQFLLDNKKEFISSSIGCLYLGLGGVRSVEMDPFDTLLNYGIIGLIIVYYFYYYLIHKLIYIKNIKKFIFSKLVLYINLILIITSIFSGHILFSGMANTFIALVNAIAYYSKTKNINNFTTKSNIITFKINPNNKIYN